MSLPRSPMARPHTAEQSCRYMEGQQRISPARSSRRAAPTASRARPYSLGLGTKVVSPDDAHYGRRAATRQVPMLLSGTLWRTAPPASFAFLSATQRRCHRLRTAILTLMQSEWLARTRCHFRNAHGPLHFPMLPVFAICRAAHQ